MTLERLEPKKPKINLEDYYYKENDWYIVHNCYPQSYYHNSLIVHPCEAYTTDHRPGYSTINFIRSPDAPNDLTDLYNPCNYCKSKPSKGFIGLWKMDNWGKMKRIPESLLPKGTMQKFWQKTINDLLVAIQDPTPIYTLLKKDSKFEMPTHRKSTYFKW